MCIAPGLPRVDRVDAVAAALVALLLVAFSLTPFLPMVDLPQHAAQLSMWIHQGDPAYPEARYFEFNWSTPYLTAYALARGLAAFAGVVVAVKVVVWASIALHYVAFRWLVRLLGYPRWTALLGVPLALGYPFFFGFISFLVAMPLALACIGCALLHKEAPTVRRGLWLAVVSSVTLASHGFAFGMAMLFVGPLLLRGGGSLWRRAAPLAAPLLLWSVWVLPGGAVRAIGATVWEPRFLALGTLPGMFFAAYESDEVSLAFGYLALVIVAVTFARPRREPERWMPLAFLLLGYCLFPRMMSGFGPLHPRFAALIVPALLVAFEPRPAAKLSGPLNLAFAAAWAITLVTRLSLWNLEVRPFARLIAGLPPHLRVRPVVFDRNSEAFPGLPVHLHLTAYYQVEKGGTQGYSFAMYPTSAVRYVTGYPVTMGQGQEWFPSTFFYEYEQGVYDIFLVHSYRDMSARIFALHEAEIGLVAREGDWRAYAVLSPPAVPTSPPIPGATP